ncbi:MAG: hypothetical protein M1828_003797 [Chrysothrix sp. TS-e1954]|nr:MAG: hypothetical protein M1828_003797 [Chrysothrix sp. TS-e1954]
MNPIGEPPAPRAKFSFKNTRKSAAVSQTPEDTVEAVTKATNVESQLQDPPRRKSEDPDQSQAPASLSSAPQNAPRANVSNLSGATLRLHSASNTTPRKHLPVANNNDCILHLGHVDGPCYLSNLTSCLIIVSCQQFRMHDSSNCDVYLHCTSRPIIEKCTSVRFAPLPEAYLEQVEEGLMNRYAAVQDFQWVGATQSPNWEVLPEAMRISSESFERLLPCTAFDELHAALGNGRD